MIVKIRKKNNAFYTSFAFAVFSDGWSSKFIVFNEKFDNLIEVNWWDKSIVGSIKCNVFQVGGRQDDCVEAGKYFGAAFIVKNKEVLKAIKKNKQIDSKIIDLALSMHNNNPLKEWNSVKDMQDAESLTDCAGGFHDALLKSFEYKGDKLELNFDTTWGFHVLMEAEGIQEITLSEKDIDTICIFDAYVKIEDSLIKWQVDSLSNDREDANEEEELYFIAKTLNWKIVIDDEKQSIC